MVQQVENPIAALLPGGATATAETSLATAHRAHTSLGWLPSISIVAAVGLLLVALGNNQARGGGAWAEALFWAGLAQLFVPIAARLCMREIAAAERAGLVTLLGLGLYLIKLLHSPIGFTFYDEFLHWRTAADILRSGHLFQSNPLLQLSPLYPGLENVTTALSGFGMPIFIAGVVVVGCARIVMMLALFLLFEQLSGSDYLAGIATLLYTAAPTFLFFDAQFSYESLALPLAILVLYLTARRASLSALGQLGLNLAALLATAALATTHHLTSYALALFLVGWWVAQSVLARRTAGAPAQSTGAMLTLAISISWFIYLAASLAAYLAPHFIEGVTELSQLISGELVGRQLFRSRSGVLAPLWERTAGLSAVALIMLGLPIGAWRIWRQRRVEPRAVALALLALLYPFTLLLRLTNSWELSQRASTFLFIAIAFTLATAFSASDRLGRFAWLRVCVGTTVAAILFAGGVVSGWPAWARQPGSYLVIADTRSIEPQGVAAALWAHDVLGANNRIMTDRINRVLMATYGAQEPVVKIAGGSLGQIITSPTLGPAERARLQAGHVRYVIIDRRLGASLPQLGFYVEPYQTAGPRPIELSTLAKFDHLVGVVRVFDSGDITIYDVGALANVP